MLAPDVSLDDLLAAASDRAVLDRTDGKSGAVLESLAIDGEPYVLKTFDLRADWLLRASGDAGCRAVALWELGLYDAVPACVDHTVVAAGRSAEWPVAYLLMRDVSPWLVPEDAPVGLAAHRGHLDDMAALHAAFWGWRDDVGLIPMATRYGLFAPRLATESFVTDHVVPGWAALRTVAPRLMDAVAPLLADPWPLCAALAETPATFLPGDWKMGNMGRHPDGRTILLDWDRPGAGPATFDLTWYLAVNCDRLPESKDAAIDAYRSSLERHGVDTGGWWERQLALALLGAFVQLGWSKSGPGQDAELAWWAERVPPALRWL